MNKTELAKRIDKAVKPILAKYGGEYSTGHIAERFADRVRAAAQ